MQFQRGFGSWTKRHYENAVQLPTLRGTVTSVETTSCVVQPNGKVVCYTWSGCLSGKDESNRPCLTHKARQWIEVLSLLRIETVTQLEDVTAPLVRLHLCQERPPSRNASIAPAAPPRSRLISWANFRARAASAAEVGIWVYKTGERSDFNLIKF